MKLAMCAYCGKEEGEGEALLKGWLFGHVEGKGDYFICDDCGFPLSSLVRDVSLDVDRVEIKIDASSLLANSRRTVLSLSNKRTCPCGSGKKFNRCCGGS